jgi:hypothetical protein
MKFICDVHISYAFSKYLKEDGYDSTHVNFILQKWNIGVFPITTSKPTKSPF